ncbi:MAG: insulinase family protein [Hyphomicrobiaceae bacterium]|nr:insulinase family protein [Hyphomicrobiaceae bacterium]
MISLLLEWRHAKKLALLFLTTFFVLTGFYFMSSKSNLVVAETTGSEGLTLTASEGLSDKKPASKYADRIQQVTSPKGITAWLVEDHSIPLMALQFAFKGGSTQDPKGREGLANFLTAMLDEGAGDIKSKKFQAMLDEMAIRIEFDASRDAFDGNFQTLTRNRDKALELMYLALNKPRFDKKALERMRGQLLAGLKISAKSPSKIASKAWFEAAYGDHPYARPVKGTQKSVKSITSKDLETYRRKVFARDTLKIGVVGDITADELAIALDKLFGDLPEKSDLVAVPEVAELGKPVRRIINMDNPQSVAQFGHQGIKREDDDFIPAYVLNYILGGGGFSSRLMEEVREKRGLAYSVYSYLYPLDHGAIFMGGVATKNEKLDKSLEVITDELKRLSENGPSEEELKNAKLYLTGSYPLRFDTSSKIASQLLWIQMDDLGIDYIDTRNKKVQDVTLKQIKSVAKRLIQPDRLIITIVGNPKSG